MSEYGYQTVDSYMEQPVEPSSVVQDLAPQPDPMDLIERGLILLNGRMKMTMDLLHDVAYKMGCDCAYAPNPECLICRARRIVEDMNGPKAE